MNYNLLNQREINEHFVQECINCNFPVIKELLTSPALQYHADINFDEAVLANLSHKDKTGEILDYLFSSPELKTHLKFSYPSIRSALLYDNVPVVDLMLEKFGLIRDLRSYLIGDYGISELDNLSMKMVDCLYFRHGDAAIKDAVLAHMCARNDWGIEHIIKNDTDLSHLELFKKIAKHGNYNMFDRFIELTGFDQDKKNISKLVNAACRKDADSRLLEEYLTNPDYHGFYDINSSRIMKKLIQHKNMDLIQDLIVVRNIKLTDAIKHIMTPEVEKLFAMRDLNDKLNQDLTTKTSSLRMKI